MQTTFHFNADNSDLIRERQALEQASLSDGARRDAERIKESDDERVKRVGAILETVVKEHQPVLDQAGVTLPVAFGLRDEERGGPGCLLGKERYVIAAGNKFVQDCTLLDGEELNDQGEMLKHLLDGAPNTPDHPEAVVAYAAAQLKTTDLPKPLPRQYKWVDEKTLQGIFLHELGHIVNGDPVHLFAKTPTSLKVAAPTLALGLTLLFGGILMGKGWRPLVALGVVGIGATTLSLLGSWSIWNAACRTDKASRKREMAADHTLIQSQEMIETMARQFKRNTVLEAMHHLSKGASQEETVRLLQQEEHDHPKPLTRWQGYAQRISSVPK